MRRCAIWSLPVTSRASADLIAADWVNEFNGGGLSTVSGWLDLLPEETVLQDPRLSVARAWIALNIGQFDDAAEWIEAAETRSAGGHRR